MLTTEIPIVETNLESNSYSQSVRPDIWQSTGGGYQPKYPRDNRKTQYIVLQKNTDLSQIDLNFLKYTENIQIVECVAEWANPVIFNDLTVLVVFPSKMRPMNTYQPYNRNIVAINTQIMAPLTDVTFRYFDEEFVIPEMESQDVRERNSLRELRLNVTPIPESLNTIDNWKVTLKITYVDESQ